MRYSILVAAFAAIPVFAADGQEPSTDANARACQSLLGLRPLERRSVDVFRPKDTQFGSATYELLLTDHARESDHLIYAVRIPARDLPTRPEVPMALMIGDDRIVAHRLDAASRAALLDARELVGRVDVYFAGQPRPIEPVTDLNALRRGDLIRIDRATQVLIVANEGSREHARGEHVFQVSTYSVLPLVGEVRKGTTFPRTPLMRLEIDGGARANASIALIGRVEFEGDVYFGQNAYYAGRIVELHPPTPAPAEVVRLIVDTFVAKSGRRLAR